MRVVIIVASSIAIVVIGITIWFQMQPAGSSATPAGTVDAPPQYDTTGGQEMRPRWDRSGGQSHDATGN